MRWQLLKFYRYYIKQRNLSIIRKIRQIAQYELF